MIPASGRSSILASLTERESWAAVTLLADLCRRSPEMRDWLCDDFARNAKTRENFAALVDDAVTNDPGVADGFAELAGEASSWQKERRRLQSRISPSAPRLYGGLTWAELERLVRRYEAGSADIAVFLFVRDWQAAGTAAASSPRLLRAAGRFFDASIRLGDKKLISQMAAALTRTTVTRTADLRAVIGYSDWWKLHALLYMLRHPRESYRTRDVRAHLASLKLVISSLDFRRFCKRHGIRRDVRAGRPRKRQASAATY